MEFNFSINTSSYPCVLLPNEIINYLNGYSLEEIIATNRIDLPKPFEIATLEPFDKSKKYLRPLYAKNEVKLSDLMELTHESKDTGLEMHKYFVGNFLLPKKPQFHKSIKVKKEINNDNNGFGEGIKLFFLLFAGLILMELPVLSLIEPIIYAATDGTFRFKDHKLIIVLINFVVLIGIIIWSKSKEDKNIKEDFDVVDVLKGSEEERMIQLEEYKNRVLEVFKMANEEVKEKQDKLIKSIHLNIENYNKELLKSRLKNINLTHNLNTRRGKSEIHFLHFLYDEFGRNVKIDMSPIMTNSFQPDFIVIEDSLGIKMDIEIDEPYALISGEIIHHDRTKDTSRNEYFLNENWIVIRFSEKQIVEFPENCVTFIRDVIEGLKSRNPIINTELKSEIFWTYEEAILMKEKRFRESYLNKLP